MIRSLLQRIFYGRYGYDKFNTFLIILYCITVIVNAFIRSVTVSVILLTFECVLLIYIFFRMFSKKIYARQRENYVYLNIIKKIKGWFSLKLRMFAERKTHKYHACPRCKAMLRFPNKKGSHTVRCPRCGNEFEVRI